MVQRAVGKAQSLTRLLFVSDNLVALRAFSLVLRDASPYRRSYEVMLS
jgi:hypothetical protein